MALEERCVDDRCPLEAGAGDVAARTLQLQVWPSVKWIIDGGARQ